MSIKKLQEIDRFYLILAGVVLLLFVALVVSARGVVSSIANSNKIPEEAIIEAGVDSIKLDEAYKSIHNKADKPLDLGL